MERKAFGYGLNFREAKILECVSEVGRLVFYLETDFRVCVCGGKKGGGIVGVIR